ncbi:MULTISPECIES: BolA family protein [Francisella]|uniref:Cell division protein BolA n=1 Tax=Francisella opportunistica TaxID=2016517 RepID=A0A345JQL0_9GAMM|nr:MULTISPECIES: BolA/IbaG family iron-sulfur metabolism protein [Francisella]APC91311.1 Cell division protein BolA [Francisella sp. MA067296]AXH29606.1 cell division protein BolA [Francisella opportunistica]AXH31257.1 cell division protein BolA [Francisella opportunistica]AXH32904.1 cell division protein BolA [Francisella opportunistica]
MDSTTVAKQIKNQILSKVEPQAIIEVIDETHKHVKHSGYTQGKYHFILNITSQKLNTITKIKAHTEIFKAVEELMPYIHALSIKIKPE